MFDTHCHLNFGAFDERADEVIRDAKRVGVDQIVIPGTDVLTSEKAVAIAEIYRGIYAAVGIHPHHVFEIFKEKESRKLGIETGYEDRSKNLDKNQISKFQSPNSLPILSSNLSGIEKLLSSPKVVAIGEVGIDRHIYQKTKYPDYKIAEEFVELQKIFLKEQIKLAIKYKKSLILHNREAKKDILEILSNSELRIADYQSVFHCCESDPELLDFAKKHKMFIGVDGDVTYREDKQKFIKSVPLDILVLETDSPFLSPRLLPPRRDTARQSNEPKNIPLIAEFVAKLKGIAVDEVAKQTTENAEILFRL